MKWERLISAREHADLTQTELGKLLGVDKMTVLRWENLKNYPDLYQLKELTNILHCSMDWLMYNEPFVLHSEQYYYDLWDVASSVIDWKAQKGDEVYPEGYPQNNPGLVRWICEMTNRKEIVEWSEVKIAMQYIQNGYKDPIILCEAAKAKRKRAQAKKVTSKPVKTRKSKKPTKKDAA